MQKTIIAPIVAVIILLLQLVFGVTVPQDTVDQVVLVLTNAVAVGTVIYGIIKNHKKV